MFYKCLEQFKTLIKIGAEKLRELIYYEFQKLF